MVSEPSNQLLRAQSTEHLVVHLQTAPAPASAGTLHATRRDRDLIARTVAVCGGNVSRAARQLGVSRGLVYRHLKRASQAG